MSGLEDHIVSFDSRGKVHPHNASLRVALQVEEKLFVRLSILCTEEFLV